MLVVVLGGGLVAALVYFGIGVYAESVALSIRDDPAVQEHVGIIEETEVDWQRTGAEAALDTMAFRLTGSKGSALAVVDVVEDASAPNGVRIRSGHLELSDGRRVPLTLGLSLDEPGTDEPGMEEPGTDERSGEGSDDGAGDAP